MAPTGQLLGRFTNEGYAVAAMNYWPQGWLVLSGGRIVASRPDRLDVDKWEWTAGSSKVTEPEKARFGFNPFPSLAEALEFICSRDYAVDLRSPEDLTRVACDYFRNHKPRDNGKPIQIIGQWPAELTLVREYTDAELLAIPEG